MLKTSIKLKNVYANKVVKQEWECARDPESKAQLTRT
jgi:hypothetical protein